MATLGTLAQLTRPHAGEPTDIDVTAVVKYFLTNSYDYWLQIFV